MPTPANSGGGSKSKSSAQVFAIEKDVSLQTDADKLLILRSALRDDKGNDKNVFQELSKFAKYNKNGIAATLQYFPAGSLPRDLFKAAFQMSKSNVKQIYEDIGYGWDTDEKRNEYREPESRFLFARQNTEDGSSGPVLAFVHFKFSLQGEVVNEMEGEPALLVFDLQVLPSAQRKGLGKFLMMMTELIARKQKMRWLMFPLVKGNDKAVPFLTKSLKGFAVDTEYGEDEVQAIYSKALFAAPKPAKAATKTLAPAESKTAEPAKRAAAASTAATTAATAAATTTTTKAAATTSTEVVSTKATKSAPTADQVAA